MNEEWEENYLSIASADIKKAKTRLTKFLKKLSKNDGITIAEWIEYIRDFIMSQKRQDYILNIIEKYSDEQDSDTPEFNKKAIHYITMFFNTEFQRAIKEKNVFYFLNASENSFDYDYYKELIFTPQGDRFLNLIYDKPVIAEILGKRGNGKTDFSTLLMSLINEMDPEAIILTNVMMKKKEDYIKYVFNDFELLKELVRKERKYIFIDEAGLQFTTFNSTQSKENKFIHMFLPLSRKFNCKFFFIYQIDRYSNKSLSEFTDIVMYKESKNKIKIKLKMEDNEMLYFKTFKSPMNFDTNAIAYFDTYIDLKLIYSQLSNIPFSKAMKKLNRILSSDKEILNYVYPKKRGEFKTLYLDSKKLPKLEENNIDNMSDEVKLKI